MWIKIDDNLPDHPKVVAAGPEAAWLYVCGLCFCNRFLTDGFISERQMRRLADVDNPTELADRLIDAGLWEQAEGGYIVHDYLEHQNSKERIEEIKRERAAAGAKGGASKGVANAKQTPSKLLQQSLSKTQADKDIDIDKEVEERKRKEKEVGAVAPALATDNFTLWFDELFELYPKKTLKQAAMKAARRIAVRDWEAVTASVKHYAQSTKVVEGFIKDLPGYLKDGYWKDYVEGPIIEVRGRSNGQSRRDEQLDDAARGAFGAGLDEVFGGPNGRTPSHNQAGNVRQLPGGRKAG